MKKALMVSNTIYQLFVLTKLAYDYKELECDLIISNQTKGQKDLYERLINCGVFRNVYYVETLDFAWLKKDTLYNKLNYNMKEFLHSKFIRSLYKTEKYDIVFVNNIDSNYTKLLIDISKRYNQLSEIYLFEDGLINYTEDFVKMLNSVSENLVKEINGIYLFNPDNVFTEDKLKTYKINKINKNDIKFKDLVNYIYDYKGCSDKYEEKIIFLEDSILGDGFKEFNDEELLDQISNVLGKENIFVKRHPRNKNDRFRAKGYKTNDILNIPWEVILLNNDFNNKLLITVCSGSMFTPSTVFNDNIKGIFLTKLVNKCGICTNEYERGIEKLCKKYEDFYMLEDIKDLY